MMWKLFIAKISLLGVFLLLVGCVADNNKQTEVLPINTIAPSSTATIPVMSNTVMMSPVPNVPETPAVSTWVKMDGWILANQIRAMLIDKSGDLWAGGTGGLVNWDLGTEKSIVYALSINPEKSNVIALSQAPDDSIWVGTFGNGIAKFDGVDWQSFTTRNGLPGDYVVSMISAVDGGLWLDAKKTRYDADDGQQFYFGHFKDGAWNLEVGGGFSWIRPLADGSILGARGDTDIANHNSIIGIYDGQKWNDLDLRGQTITAVTIAPDGVIWVATWEGIFRYVNDMWKKITPPWDGTSADVSSMVISSDGTAWFGFSYGVGLFPGSCGLRMDYAEEWGAYYYDGQGWKHFTKDDGLVDNKICSIVFDAKGNVYFGSYDKGVSRFDGQNWKSYVIP